MTRPIDDLSKTAEKIKSMEIRGAALIGRAAAKSLKDYALKTKFSSLEDFDSQMNDVATILLNTRPTAVSLSNAIRSVMRYRGEDAESACESLVSNADEFVERSLKAIEKIAEIGNHMIREGDTILTHCNSSVALSIIREAHQSGKDIKVIATESRPRYQGHLTAKMLDDWGILTELIVDSAVRTVINEVDSVVVGADVVTANGTLVNKIGTSQIALCAHEARTNFMVAAETYKFSPDTIMGELVPIEMRSEEEVYPDISKFENVTVRNPAFDVTPHHYIDIICTEVGAIPPEMSYLIIKEMLGWELENRLL